MDSVSRRGKQIKILSYHEFTRAPDRARLCDPGAQSIARKLPRLSEEPVSHFQAILDILVVNISYGVVVAFL